MGHPARYLGGNHWQAVKKRIPALLLLVLGFAQSTHAASARPNFLFVYTDDQRWDALGVVQREQGEKGRFPWFLTPNMDRLAAEGVRFRNAFVTSSLCSPSRACFLTGQYNHLNGVANNRTPFPTNSVTYASLLRAAGYRTGYIGKWHMGSQSGQRPGFDFSASFVGQGHYIDCPVEVNGVSQSTHGWVDDVSTEFAIQFMRSNRAAPFALVVGFKSPHDPRTPPDRWKTAFTGETARPPVSLHALPPYITEGGAGGRNGRAGAAISPDRKLDYFRCIAAADENLGKLLAVLDELGLAENTVVVCTSDNGYYLGEHGLGDKRSAYEESMRIPLLLRYPKLGLKGATVDEEVLNIDLAPTFLDFAGVPVPMQMQGKSWRPLLQHDGASASVPWRSSFFYEYFYERPYNVPTLFALRTPSAKLIEYKDHADWTEVFDLARDPYEMKNLDHDPASAGLEKQLSAEYERQKEQARFVEPAGLDQPQVEPPRSEAIQGWVLEYRFDQDKGDEVRDASGKGNKGRASEALLTAEPGHQNARRFDGHGFIEVPKSSSLNPALRKWTVEVTLKAAAPDGVILAQGGASYGYCLALEKGHPVFVVVGAKQKTKVMGSQSTGDNWITLRASFDQDSISLVCDGAAPAQAKLVSPLAKEPHETLQIGDDLGTAVMGEQKPPAFKGLISSVRIYSGTGYP